MHQGRMVFAQVMDLVPWRKFQACAEHYHGDEKIYALTTKNFFKIMMFAQIAPRESLRDTVSCLNAVGEHLYGLGLPRHLVRTNIAHANHCRDWRIFYEIAQVLMTQTKQLYQTPQDRFHLEACIYALDSTTIDLCLALFPWAHFRRTKSAVKMHVALDLQGEIPDFILISTGNTHDVKVMDVIRLGGRKRVYYGSRYVLTC